MPYQFTDGIVHILYFFKILALV